MTVLSSQIKDFIDDVSTVEKLKEWICFLRSNAWHRNGAYNTALDLTMNTCDNSSQMPLVNLFQRDDVFFATDINHIQHLNQRLVSLYAQVETITVEGKVVSILILKYFFEF